MNFVRVHGMILKNFLEQYIGKEEWDDETLDQIADLCVNSWKELKAE